MKKLLIITYYWPPSGGAGVQRTLKFVKYLPEFNVEPVVLTVHPDKATYPAIDHSLSEEVKNVKVFRTNSFEALQVLAGFAGKKNIPHAGFANVKKETFFQKTLRFIRGNFFIPDARKGWNNYAFQKAVELIDAEKINTVLISSPPHSSQLIGLRLKKRFPQLKWIADLRDPWTDIYYYPQLLHTPFAAAIDAKMERSVLKSADELIVVSEPIQKLFLQKDKSLEEKKFHVIPNGFDEVDFKKSIRKSDDQFTITYVGTLAESYNPEVFIRAFSRLLQTFSSSKINLTLVGTMPESIAGKVKTIQENFKDSITFIPYVEHDQAIVYMQSANALLLIIPEVKNSEGILTGKLFEYLGAGAEIIGIGPKQGSAAKIISSCEAGKMFERNEEEELFRYMTDLVEDWKNKKMNAKDTSKRLQYSRKNLTGKLAELV